MGINKQCWVGIEMLMKSDTLINNNETKGEYNSKTWWNWRRKVRVPKSFQFWKRWESFCFLHKLSIKQQLLNCHLSHLSWIVHQTSMRNLFKTLSLSKAQPWLWFWNWKLASYASMGESFLLLLSCTEEKILPPSCRLRSLLFGVPKNFERLFFISFLFVSKVSSSVINDHETRDATWWQFLQLEWRQKPMLEQFLEEGYGQVQRHWVTEEKVRLWS